MNRSLNTTIKLSITLLTTGILAACSPGFGPSIYANCDTQASCAADSGNHGSDFGNGSTPSTGRGNWDGITMDGSISGGRFDKTKTVEIDTKQKILVLRLPFIPGIQIGLQIPTNIKEIPGATIGIEPNDDGSSSSLVLRIPLEKVLRGVDSLPKGRLPNGDRLPAIPDGELPSLGLSFNNQKDLRGALYLSPTVVGLFINTKFDPYISLTLPIRDEARTQTFGYFTSVPAKPGYDGGFFLSIKLPDDLARAIDDLL